MNSENPQQKTDLMGMREQWMWRAVANTNVGMLRDHNEDNLGMIEEQGLFVVADGMGGHAAGEVASQIAVDTLLEYFEHTRGGGDELDEEPSHTLDGLDTEAIGDAQSREEVTLDDEAGKLEASIKLANLRIFDMGSKDKDRKGMGTTIVAMKVCDGLAHLAHVGDSRIYLCRDGELLHMTRDHSWFADLMANAHEFTPQTLAYAARYKNVITRALGMEASVEVDLSRVDVEPGDLFLLCSDGLHDMIEDDEIAGILLSNDQLEQRCEALITAANRAGGDDNISVMLIQAEPLSIPSTLTGEEE